MRKLSDDEFIVRGNLSAGDSARLKKSLPLLRERAQTFKEAGELLRGELSCLFNEPTLERGALVAKELPGRPDMTKLALQDLLKAIETFPEALPAEAVKSALMPLADAEEAKGKGGRGAMLWPLRYALSGQERSPDPFTLVAILGPHEAISRIQKAIAIL